MAKMILAEQDFSKGIQTRNIVVPKMEARVLQELAVHKTDRVLEVGTGSGYLTALLAHRASQVHSVEIDEKLAQLGRDQRDDYEIRY